jgi:hypothetical protein
MWTDEGEAGGSAQPRIHSPTRDQRNPRAHRPGLRRGPCLRRPRAVIDPVGGSSPGMEGGRPKGHPSAVFHCHSFVCFSGWRLDPDPFQATGVNHGVYHG